MQLNESSDSASSLPSDIVQSIAISNAHSISEQPAILANLALAQKIFNQNMQQQNAVSHQQALNQIKLAVVGKYVAMINSVGLGDQAATEKMGEEIEKLVRQLERIIDDKASDSVAREAS
ncbi:FAD-binding monooxygenase [Dyella flagellata]